MSVTDPVKRARELLVAASGEYRDPDGNVVTLDKLCRIEPAWAANRIRHERQLLADLLAELEAAEAALAAERTLPNGWPAPCFISRGEFNDDLTIEWIFGAQGHSDSWRVMYSWDIKEGAMACVTHARQVFTEEPAKVTALLDAALTAKSGPEALAAADAALKGPDNADG